SRLLVNAFYAIGFQDEKYYGRAKKWKTINFVGKRRLFFAISILLICVGPAAMGISSAAGRGALNLSMDFMGGTSTSVTFGENLTIEQIDADVKPLFQEVTGDAEIQAQKVADSNEVILKTRVLSL